MRALLTAAAIALATLPMFAQAEKAKDTATVTLVTEAGKRIYLECTVEKAEPRFLIFVSAKGRMVYETGMKAPIWEHAGKRITHSGDYTIVPD
jgi:hypothetical protein